jgi:nitrogen fixation protein FixH
MTMQMLKGMCSAAIVVGVIATTGCNNQQPANQAPPAAQTSAPATPAPSQAAEITLKTTPDPAKAGENTFEVMVMQDAKPVTDANVTVELYMAAMPQMKMPEMKNKVDLTHAGNGVYRGTGQVMMAGNWDVTVMAMRGGQEIATKKMPLTAK